MIRDPKAWEMFADIATVFSLVIASVAAAGIFWQVRSQRLGQRELIAKQLNEGFLRLAVEHPKLASPNFDQIRQSESWEQYSWFALYMLNTMEEILSMSAEKHWRRVVHTNLGYHARYLASQEFRTNEYNNFNAELRALIDAASAAHTNDHQPRPTQVPA